MSQDGKSLLDKLQRPLTPGSSDSLTASANYSKAVRHVLDVIHEVLHHQRQLENIWQHRKVRLHQRLQLCVFQQDVQQVGFISLCLSAFVFCRPDCTDRWVLAAKTHVLLYNKLNSCMGLTERYQVLCIIVTWVLAIMDNGYIWKLVLLHFFSDFKLIYLL